MYQDVEEFLEVLSMRGRAETTVKYYRYVLNRCLTTLESNGYSPSAKDVGIKEISFLLRELDVKESTKTEIPGF